MDRYRNELAGTFNWLGALWLVGWSLYVALLSNSVPTSTETMQNLAALLIPAGVAFAIAWALGRFPVGWGRSRSGASVDGIASGVVTSK